VESVTLPPPGTDGARVRMLAAPINPADLNVLEGKYPIRPELPGTPGVEGVGVVEEIGNDVKKVREGDRVLLPAGFGSWREAGVVADADAALQVVPAGVPIEQAAMLRINPATALRMLRDFVELAPGDFVIQNAANSAVGRLVIQIARAAGWRTINLVRRLALNAVGGESALRLANALAPGGTTVTFGAMGRQPLRIPNGLLIFRDLRWRGFWISQWYREAAPDAEAAMFAELFDLAARDVMHSPVERIYPLSEATAAIQHAAKSQRAGKILFGAPEIVAQFPGK
jgi:trans-2-enoyl-CoA reductase